MGHLIELMTSSWVLHVVLIRQKYRSEMFCVDYRKLNEVTIKDILPRFNDTADAFRIINRMENCWQISRTCLDNWHVGWKFIRLQDAASPVVKSQKPRCFDEGTEQAMWFEARQWSSHRKTARDRQKAESDDEVTGKGDSRGSGDGQMDGRWSEERTKSVDGACKDRNIGWLIGCKKAGIIPTFVKVSSRGSKSKAYSEQWESLLLQQGLLCFEMHKNCPKTKEVDGKMQTGGALSDRR